MTETVFVKIFMTYVLIIFGPQNIKLEGSKDVSTFFTSQTITWIIESCSRVTIHGQALSAVNGNQFELQLINLSALEIHESAFELNSSK